MNAEHSPKVFHHLLFLVCLGALVAPQTRAYCPNDGG